MPIAARYADVWHCFGPPDFLGPKSERLSAMAENAGRDPSSILRAASLSLEDDTDEIARNVDAWRDVGFGYLVCGWPPQGEPRVREFAERFLT
jgi:alkanesulfonate monooxygenase SsuD/methylene tetrahydromethanopterin reductase-like flavin-dependent oxidoreductase (luciferase family)